MRLVLALFAALLLTGCGQTEEVPRQPDAVAQFFYARETWYAPAFSVQGKDRQARLRQAVEGFQAVVRYFPEDSAVTTRVLAEYYTGLCRMQLGETDRARAAFMRCRDVQAQANGNSGLHEAGRATLRTIMDQAREQIRRLDEVKPAARKE